MKYILDTHIILWLITDDVRLSDEARKIILSKENKIYYSVASVWEVTIKNNKNKDILPITGIQFEKFCVESGLKEIEIRSKQVHRLNELKPRTGKILHNDPFDRIILSQAKDENMCLMTHDEMFSNYDEECIKLV